MMSKDYKPSTGAVPACLIGGPADGTELPKRYATAERIQVPITDGTARFATYRQEPEGSRRFVFEGFSE